MPKGSPVKQTIATAKYQAKAGYMTKSFKLKREVVSDFEQAVKRSGESQAAVITEFMKNYIMTH